MNLQSKFGYCMTTQTLNIALRMLVGRNYGRTNGQTDGQTDRWTIQTLDAPGGPFRSGHKKDIDHVMQNLYLLRSTRATGSLVHVLIWDEVESVTCQREINFRQLSNKRLWFYQSKRATGKQIILVHVQVDRLSWSTWEVTNSNSSITGTLIFLKK